MPKRVLMVDGNEAERTKMADRLSAAGCAVDQAPDGIEAFESVLAQSYDLVVSEASLARLDVGALIGKLRGHGLKTPVLVLSSVTKATTIGALIKLGIAEYVSKLLPPDLIVQKIVGHLPVESAVKAPDAPAPSTSTSAEAAAVGPPLGGRVLLIDAIDVDQQRVRAALPSSVALDTCQTVNDGLARARAGHYGMVVLDNDAAALNMKGTIAQFRALQPEAAIVGLATLGRHDDPVKTRPLIAAVGFDEVVWKPIGADCGRLLAERYCTSWDDLVTAREDVVEISRRFCRRAQWDRYTHELVTRTETALRALSDACFDRAIVNLTRAEQLCPSEAGELIARLEAAAHTLGITLQVAVPTELAAGLRQFKESFVANKFRWFTSVDEARAA